MDKESLKRRKQDQTISQSGELLPPCPLCRTTNAQKAVLAAFDDLLHSHAELCSVVRSVGRQMLQFENQDRQSLDRLRVVLKRADNIRQTLRLQEEYPETPKKHPFEASVECSGEQAINDAPIHKGGARNHLSRPRSLRIVRFPAR
jgi:hypothetical protein